MCASILEPLVHSQLGGKLLYGRCHFFRRQACLNFLLLQLHVFSCHPIRGVPSALRQQVAQDREDFKCLAGRLGVTGHRWVSPGAPSLNESGMLSAVRSHFNNEYNLPSNA